MSKPTMSETMSANFAQLPGMGAMNDTLELVKNMWGGGMKLPGMAMPTLSVESVDKQIADLKAVESWMTLNMNMLRGTIQALEVQSATLSTLKTMSDSVSAMVLPGGMHATPGGFFTAAETPPPRSAANASPEETYQSESPFSFVPPVADKPPAPAPEPEARQADGASWSAAGQPGQEDAGVAPPFANPAAWWNLLQDQFKQAVQTAVSAEPERPASSPRATARSVVKSASKSPSKAASKAGSMKKPNGSAVKTRAKSAPKPAAIRKTGKAAVARSPAASSRSASAAASRKSKT
jgi:hypothetical protein